MSSSPCPLSRFEFFVHKFGGTSLGDAACFRQVASLLTGPEAIGHAPAADHDHDEPPHLRASPLRQVAVAVVSAVGGVTDSLASSLRLAVDGDGAAYRSTIASLLELHTAIAKELLPHDERGAQTLAEVTEELKRDTSDILALLRATAITRSYDMHMFQVVTSYGELWSSLILWAFISHSLSSNGTTTPTDISAGGDSGGAGSASVSSRCLRLDARQVLVVERAPGAPGDSTPNVCEAESQQLVSGWVATHLLPGCNGEHDRGGGACVDYIVATGYVATTPARTVHTTLGRNGSDLSAALFTNLLRGKVLSIWKDVDGLYSADPRLVPSARLLQHVSYREAMELSYFGAKVLHPRALTPLINSETPVWIRNTHRPDGHGTLISVHGNGNGNVNGSGSSVVPSSGSSKTVSVKGFSFIDRISLVNLEGSTFAGVAGVSERLFRALHDASISVLMISQGGSEHSICLAVPEDKGEAAAAAVQRAFQWEIDHLKGARVELLTGQCILAAVGDRLQHQVGVAGQFFGALASSRINVRAIAQGSSERNISVVIDRVDAKRALQSAHARFYGEWSEIAAVAVVGTGLIGAELLRMLDASDVTHNTGSNPIGVSVRVAAIANSKRMLLYPTAAITAAAERLSTSTTGMAALGSSGAPSTAAVEQLDLQALERHLLAQPCATRILVDCTSSEHVAACYPRWLARGIHVVTPNKKALSGPYDTYRQIRELMLSRQPPRASCWYETTVGAGLPVISTVRDLLGTGHCVRSIDGVLSGTLSFLFNEFAKGERCFSDIVLDAKAKGYTEPDPRDDLSGMDVARKVTILAREIGLRVELADLQVNSLVPEPLRHCSVDEYLAKLPLYDADMAEMLKDATAHGECLRFVGSIHVAEQATRDARCSVGIRRFAADGPLGAGRLHGADNILVIHTQWYDQLPLVIQGPGAGAAVTASGVFAEILKIVSYS